MRFSVDKMSLVFGKMSKTKPELQMHPEIHSRSVGWRGSCSREQGSIQIERKTCLILKSQN